MKALSILVEDCIKPKISIEQIAKKHNVSIDVVKKALTKGTKVEKEHTNSDDAAQTIASHHLYELIDYYEKLDKIENK